jgi:hypothetical protein
MIFPSSANDAARRSDVNGLLRTPASRRADRKRNRDRRASGYANWAARSDAAASITGRRSSIRCSVEGISLTRSDNPVPRLCQTRSTAKTTPAGAETAPAPASPTRAPDSSRTPAQKPDRVAITEKSNIQATLRAYRVTGGLSRSPPLLPKMVSSRTSSAHAPSEQAAPCAAA